MTTEVKPLILLSYDKEPVVLYETYHNLYNGTWRLEIRDNRGRLLHTDVVGRETLSHALAKADPTNEIEEPT